VLEQRRIVVTGASGGIGRSLVRAYADAGARVWAVARREGEIAETAAGRGGVVAIPADLTSQSGRRAVATSVEHDGGALDVVVHAAGALGPVGTPLRSHTEAEWREVLEINVTAIQLLHQELAGPLDRGDKPAVIALSSTVGRQGRAGWGIYAVSKHALEGWVAVLSREWEDGRVYSVNPGGTRTPMRAEARPDEDPTTIPHPDDITPLFLHLAHPACSQPTGGILEARDWIGRDPWEGLQGRADPA
jgi:NAD(P)-dependent dehydrogenase (short-subunit alcohol dehydrogenase family)